MRDHRVFVAVTFTIDVGSIAPPGPSSEQDASHFAKILTRQILKEHLARAKNVSVMITDVQDLPQ
jgi:hypothetical protein